MATPALSRLRTLKSLGVQLAIDDFGMGYSSLSSLERFPIDVLKIDKSFVSHVGADESRRSFARMIVALGDALSLRTIAEGVERPEQAAALTSMGCTFAQGFYFSRPVPAAEITQNDPVLAAWVRRRRSRDRERSRLPVSRFPSRLRFQLSLKISLDACSRR